MATDPTRENFQPADSFDGTEDKDSLTAKAERCRRLAAGISDHRAADVLNSMARNYEAAADRLPPQD